MKAQQLKPCPRFERDVNQHDLQRNFSPCTHYVHILLREMEGERKKRENTKERKKNKTGAWGQGSPREKERERHYRVFVRDSLSYGINGGLMGYERMFYWKQ